MSRKRKPPNYLNEGKGVAVLGTASRAETPSPGRLIEHFSGAEFSRQHTYLLGGLAGLLGIVFLWSYLPDFGALVHAWNTESDYSHGFLVVPIALFCLYARRDSMPRELRSPAPMGLTLIVLSVVWRILAERFYLPEMGNWSMIPFIAGCCWLLGGWKFFVWTLPSVLFLIFMMKLPFRAETLMGTPLRRVSAHLGSWMLQCLGQPAVPEYTTISLGDERLEVAQACAGLRMFIGVFALICAYLILSERPWWQKLFLLVAAAPMAVLANSIRIMVTGLAYQWVSNEFGRQFAHDFAGWLVIPLAALFFFGCLWFLDRAFVQVRQSRGVQTVI